MDTDLRSRLAGAFRWVDPGPHTSRLVSDRSGWWRDPVILRALGPALAGLFPGERPTVVVSPPVTGFLLGPLVAQALGTGFVEACRDDPERRVAEPVTWAATPPDYRGRSLLLGVRTRHLEAGDRVLLVDDWVVTGAQVRALYAVVGALGAPAVGTAAIVAECPDAVAADLRVRGLLRGSDLDPP